MIRQWWRRWTWKRERRRLEVYLFNVGPHSKWAYVHDENTLFGVWKGWPL